MVIADEHRPKFQEGKVLAVMSDPLLLKKDGTFDDALIANAITKSKGAQKVNINALPTTSIIRFMANADLLPLSGLVRSG